MDSITPPFRSARLQSGQVSSESHIHPASQSGALDMKRGQIRETMSLSELTRQVEALSQEVTSLGPSPLEIQTKERQPYDEDTQVVERPAWQAFLLAIQLHNPELAQDIEPAHLIGLHRLPRLSMTQEGIDSLNYFIDKWYGAEVEIVITHALHHPLDPTTPGDEAWYHYPYRPVTGLRVIVTSSDQYAGSEYDRGILHARDRWGYARGIQAVSEGYELYVHEHLQSGKSPEKKRTRKYLLPQLVGTTGKRARRYTISGRGWCR
jgi:hypothetical protein